MPLEENTDLVSDLGNPTSPTIDITWTIINEKLNPYECFSPIPKNRYWRYKKFDERCFMWYNISEFAPQPLVYIID